MDIKKRTLNAVDEAALLNDLLDIQDWVDAAITGKIHSCKVRMCNAWRPILYADESVTQISNDNDELVPVILARDDYKTRVERDAAQDAEAKADDSSK
mgnify:CR=1 FL=1